MLGLVVVSVENLALQGGQVNSLILGDRMCSINDVFLHLSVHQVHLYGIILVQVGIFEKELLPAQQVGESENMEKFLERTGNEWVGEYIPP